MVWKKLNNAVEYWDRLCLGSVDGKKPVMALALDKRKKNGKYFGIVRCIIDRKGHPDFPGFVDQGQLFIVESKDLLKWKKLEPLKMKGIDEIVDNLSKGDKFFIGLEDPSIFLDGEKIHLYFTIAFKLSNQKGYAIYLGHAFGKDLKSLVAAYPVLSPEFKDGVFSFGFKEASISPEKFDFGRINLVECGHGTGDTAIGAVSAKNFDEWRFLRIVADPCKMKNDWNKGDLSPAFIFEPSFLRHGKFLVGVLNGREQEMTVGGKKRYGKFRPGLFLFNPRTGEIPWISPEPLFEDPDATTITFASDFIQTSKEEGILYAHVNDSFVRAYRLKARALRKLISGI